MIDIGHHPSSIISILIILLLMLLCIGHLGFFKNHKSQQSNLLGFWNNPYLKHNLNIIKFARTCVRFIVKTARIYNINVSSYVSEYIYI